MPLVTAHPGRAYLGRTCSSCSWSPLTRCCPLVPGETAVPAGAAMAARGDLEPAGVLAATVVGAFGGDLASYAAGPVLRRHPALAGLPPGGPSRGCAAPARPSWSPRGSCPAGA